MKKKMKKKRSLESAGIPATAVPVVARPISPSWFLVTGAILIGLLIMAYVRNNVYLTPVTLWADNVVKSPNKRRTHENYGQALSTAGLYSEALDQFKTVLALKDDGSVPLRDLYREIGVVYFRIGLIDQSIDSWKTGLKYAPYDPSLLNNLSVAYLRHKRFDDAETAIRQALAGAPYMPQALNSLGEILMVKGNYEEALKYFLQAIQSSPDGPSRYWNAAIAFEKTGRRDMAMEYANKYLAMEPNPEMRQRAAMYINKLQTSSSARQ
jgi:tetratricopeptide (TPR) repeat protein